MNAATETRQARHIYTAEHPNLLGATVTMRYAGETYRIWVTANGMRDTAGRPVPIPDAVRDLARAKFNYLQTV